MLNDYILSKQYTFDNIYNLLYTHSISMQECTINEIKYKTLRNTHHSKIHYKTPLYISRDSGLFNSRVYALK